MTRSEKAFDIATGASQWLKCRAANGAKRYGIPAASKPGRYYLTNQVTCDCQDFLRRGEPCKHVLAVRLHCQAARPSKPATNYDDIFARFEGD